MHNHPSKLAVNLKHLPPIDPFRITNSSSKGKLNSSCSSASAKVVKPSPNHDQVVKLLDSDKGIVTNANFGNAVVEDASSISSDKKSASPTQTHSAHQGMKKGTARSNLYEICAAKHWKPPIFDCCKEEGPSHKRMFTFKVIIETEETPENIIECYGAPHRKKKAAADHAAVGALWYLKHLGCVLKP